jgi:hypothetical protein
VIALAATVGAAIGLASPVAASATTLQTPYFIEWTVGTPYPTVPAGYHLVALPTPDAIDGLAEGSTLPTVSPSQAIADPSGIVNLIAEPDSFNFPYCVRYVYKHLGQKVTNVAQSYTTVNGIDMGFTYGQGQSSSLGVGQSIDNPNGGFSGDGTTGVSTTRTQSMPTYTTKSYNHWQTYFLVDEIQYRCPVHDLYYLLPYKWAGGDAVAHPSSAPGAPYCVPEMRGSRWDENNSSATTFGVGWNAFGFNGSAHTGYSGSADTYFTWNVSGHICAVHDVPGGSPGILVGT